MRLKVQNHPFPYMVSKVTKCAQREGNFFGYFQLENMRMDLLLAASSSP